MPESTDNTIASSRVPVTPSTHEELKEFRNGLDASFDEAILFLLHLAKGNDDTYLAGKQMRKQFKEFKNSQNG
jgi:hypothetical protein